MSRKIGDVHIEGDYDGDRALVKARKNVKDIERMMSAGMGDSGRDSGDAWAKEFGRVFASRMRDFVKRSALPQFNKQMAETVTQSRDLARAGRDLERSFPDFTDDIGYLRVVKERVQELGGGFDRLAIESGEASRAIRDSNQSLRDGSKALVVYENGLNRAGNATRNLRREQDDDDFGKRFISRIGGIIGWLFKYDKQSRKTVRSNRSLRDSWKNLSHNTRQWTLIIAAIAAALPTLSVLGSAAGGALAVLGNTAVTLVASVGLAIAGFKGLFDENAKLSDGAKASKNAFQELGQAFKDLQPGIVNEMFDSMAGSIERLTKNLIPGIEGGLYNLSGAIGDAMGSLMDMFSSPEAISIFNGLLDTASKTIGPLLEGIGGLFLGILAVFEQASPLAESFAGWLQQIGTDFLAWTQSDEGRDRIELWLETAARILPLLGELLVATGQALADLVTPSSIANTEAFLTSLTEFMAPLSGLLDILGELDVFGVLAAALNSVGQALAPLQGPLSDLASLISTTLKGAFEALGPALSATADFLSPIIDAVVDLLTPIFERLTNEVLPTLADAWGKIMEALAPVGEAIQGLVDAMQPVVSFLIDVLLNAFNFVFPAIQFVVDMVVGIITGLIEGLTKIFSGITQVVENWGSDWGAVWEGVWMVIDGVVQFIWNLISVLLIGRVFALLKTGLKSVGSFFSTIWTNIQTVVKNAITNVSKTLANILNSIKSFWTSIWGGIKNTASTIWEGIKTAVRTAINAVKKVITDVLNNIKSFWKTIWDGLKSTVKTVWNGIKSAIKAPIDAIKGFINSLKKPIDAAIGWFNSLFGAANKAESKSGSASGGGGRRVEMAAGGILRQPTNVLAGEAGPEAFIPLNRPLSQVNPDVRWLSAIAQGKAPAAEAAPTRREIIFQPGSVVVQGAQDPRATAFEVMDLVAERIGS